MNLFFYHHLFHFFENSMNPQLTISESFSFFFATNNTINRVSFFWYDFFLLLYAAHNAYLMNKRKIEINELKKLACKGKKMRTITVKYEAVLAYFKTKDSKEMHVFQITFAPLISDLLNLLAATEFVAKLQNQSSEPLKALTTSANTIRLEGFQLKALSNEYPLMEICGCLCLEGGDKKHLTIQRSKLMTFFKHMRAIYADFCYCAGEKAIVEGSELKLLYQLFQAQWSKYEEKGRLNPLERLEKKICKSLFFLGLLIENNIFQAIEAAQRKKREEESECGTRSEHKKNIKGVNQQSTVHTFSSLDPSSLSVRLKSQTSQEEHFPSSRNNLSQYSQKSQKIISRSRFDLWDKAELKQLKFKLGAERDQSNSQVQAIKYQINYLSNDVENILIEQAFKIQRLFTNPMDKANQYMMVDYNANPNLYSHNLFQPQQYNGYYMQNYLPYNYSEPAYPNYLPHQYLSPYDNQHPDTSSQLNQLKRSLGCMNLVQTRKKDRYQ